MHGREHPNQQLLITILRAKSMLFFRAIFQVSVTPLQEDSSMVMENLILRTVPLGMYI